MGEKKYFWVGAVRSWFWCALFVLGGFGCSGRVESGNSATTVPPSSCDGFEVGELLEAAQPCSQIGKRCAFDVDGVPVAPEPESALKCECLDPYPLTYHCGPRVWP